MKCPAEAHRARKQRHCPSASEGNLGCGKGGRSPWLTDALNWSVDQVWCSAAGLGRGGAAQSSDQSLVSPPLHTHQSY